MSDTYFIVTRDKTPEGNVCIWRSNAPPEYNEYDGMWDRKPYDDQDLVVEISSYVFTNDTGLKIARGEIKFLDYAWRSAE